MAYRRGGVGYGRMKKGPRFEAKAQELKAVSLASASKLFIQKLIPFFPFYLINIYIFSLFSMLLYHVLLLSFFPYKKKRKPLKN